MADGIPVYDLKGNPLSEEVKLRALKFGEGGYTLDPYNAAEGSGSESMDGYVVIRAETSPVNVTSRRYYITNIPIPWKLDVAHDFYVVAISVSGEVIKDVAGDYLLFDPQASTLTVKPLFGEEDYCVYIFRDEYAANLFTITSDGEANIKAILRQFEKDNRVLRQLQELSRRTLHCPDILDILPEAKFRANAILTFDADGQPSLKFKDTDLEIEFNIRASEHHVEEMLQENKDILAEAKKTRTEIRGMLTQVKNMLARSEEILAQNTAIQEDITQKQQQVAEDAAYVRSTFDALTRVYDTDGKLIDGERAEIRIIKVSDDVYTMEPIKKT